MPMQLEKPIVLEDILSDLPEVTHNLKSSQTSNFNDLLIHKLLYTFVRWQTGKVVMKCYM